MPRSQIVAAGVIAVLVGWLVPAGAGNNGPEWTSSPTQGPSPNTIQVSGTHCEPNLSPRGPGVVLGGLQTGTARVVLRNLADSADLHEEFYDANLGAWAGDFPIPAGLSPGTYPLKATCQTSEKNGFQFDYEPDRSYTVPAKAKKAEAVEAEAAFTG
jgi:hypothetical protein